MALDEGLPRRVVNASLRDQKDFFLENETKEPLPGLRMKQNNKAEPHTAKPWCQGVALPGEVACAFPGESFTQCTRRGRKVVKGSEVSPAVPMTCATIRV